MEQSLALKIKIRDLRYMSNIYEINSFNSIVDKAVKSLQKGLEENRQEAKTESGYLKYIEIELKNKSIQTVQELKIINEYRSLELFTKKLIYKAFDEEDDKNLFKWNNLLSFFKKKKIFLKEIEGYDEVLQLKDTNNALKHSLQSLTSDKHTKCIPEFQDLQNVDSESLKNFYERVLPKVLTFVRFLTDEIIENLEAAENN